MNPDQIAAEKLGDIWSEKFKGRTRDWQGSLDVSWNERQAWEAVATYVNKHIAAAIEKAREPYRVALETRNRITGLKTYDHALTVDEVRAAQGSDTQAE